jgi:hypothetical protein
MSSGCKSQPARQPAPAYRGEGEHALWHVSEDASLGVLEPHRARTAASDDLLVWAVDTRHLPLFWGVPGRCPRATFWAASTTREEDVERFLDGRRDRRVHVIECVWLGRMRSARVLAYRLPEATSGHIRRWVGTGSAARRSSRRRSSRWAICRLMCGHAHKGMPSASIAHIAQ